MTGGLSLRPTLAHPARVVALSFVVGVAVGALLLMLPWASESGESVGVVDAVFTSTSALCVTGLAVVDTGSHWSTFGQVVLLLLIQLGGLGITTFASLFAVLISRKLGLRSRLIAQAETGALELGSVRQLVVRVVAFSLFFEAIGFVLLSARFWLGHDHSLADAAFTGLFHSVSAFNNAGFSTFEDSLIPVRTDPLLLGVVMGLVVVGGIGFPVLQDIREHRGGRVPWSLHTKLTVSTTAALLVVGAVGFLAFEWTNPGTIGDLGTADKLVNGLFGSVTPRTAGFNTIDYGAADDSTLLLTKVLMLIGGGSASAAGGIKVTTFALLGFVIWAELRGEPDVNVFGRRVPTAAQRQALAVALLGVGAVIGGALLLGVTTPFELPDTLFESISALATVGLSTGLTPDLPDPARVVLVVLMLVGRLGPLTAGTALVLRAQERLYRYPEGRPLIG